MCHSFNGALNVLLGEHNRYRNSDSVHRKKVPVRMVIAHPLFNSSTNDNDIAIIMLESELRLDDVGPAIAPICPPNPRESYDRHVAYIAG